MRILVSLVILLGMIVITGCQQPGPMDAGKPLGPGSSPVVVPLTDTPTQMIDTPDKNDKTTPKNPERVLPTEDSTPVTGEVPNELLDPIVKDLAGRTGAASKNIAVVQAQAIVWNDGSWDAHSQEKCIPRLW